MLVTVFWTVSRETSSCTRTGARSVAWFFEILRLNKKFPNYLYQLSSESAWLGSMRTPVLFPGREKFFSLKFILKSKWTKWWRITTRTRTTQVIPWSLADGRRQKGRETYPNGIGIWALMVRRPMFNHVANNTSRAPFALCFQMHDPLFIVAAWLRSVLCSQVERWPHVHRQQRLCLHAGVRRHHAKRRPGKSSSCSKRLAPNVAPKSQLISHLIRLHQI